MADISVWQQSLEAPKYLVDPNRLVTSLYECCLQLFLCFVESPVPGLDSSIRGRLHTQAQKFKLWGASFNAREGELDQKLVDADRLKNALLPILSGMGETLITLARRLNKVEELADTCSQFQLLKVQVSEVTTQSCLNDDDAFPQISLDELSSLESGDSSVDEMAELEDLLRDIQSYNACLFGLSSVLEDPAEKAIPGVDDSQSLEASNRELLKNAAWPYITSIIETYPSIDKTFARRLGEANELRYARLQAWRERAQVGPTDTDSDDFCKEIIQETQPSQSQGRVSSDFTTPSTELSSIFDSNSFNPAKKPKVRAPASVTTFASSVLEGNSQKRSRGIPKMPEDQPWGTPFSCTVCGDYLENVWSSVQWVRHVYQDLQPYVCSFADCSSGIETFVSRRQWGEHEFTEHREKQPKDLNRTSKDTCPFCQTLPAGPRSQFISHVGRHMQEISHAAIPMSAMTDDDGDLELSDEDNDTIHDSIAAAQIAEPEPVFFAPAGFRPNSLFVGREKDIERLDKLFFDERRRNWGGTVAVLLHGMPGVGKTQIAREYAFANREEFKGGTFWIPAQSKELIFHNLNNLMQRFAIRVGSGDLIRSVNIWLETRRNWLLVFDGLSVEENGDITEISKVAPNSKDSGIIYVARSRSLSTLQPLTTLKIGPLSKEASRCLLFKELNLGEANERQRVKATEIIESVGSLPLAIHAIARRLAATHQPLEKYMLPVSDLSLGGTFQIILDDLLRAGHTEAWNLLHIMCWFAPRMPVEMLLLGLKDQKDIGVMASEEGGVPDINTTFAQLIRYGLVERNEPDDAMDEGSDVDLRGDPEPIDMIEMQTVMQSFCCDSLNTMNLLAEWLEHAVQVFCSSYRRADGKMKQRLDGPRVYDYRHYMTHGQKLWDRCSFYRTKDRSLGYLEERVNSVIESIEQEIGRRISLEAQPNFNPQSLKTSIFDRTSESDSDSPYYDSEPNKSMSHAEAKALLQRHQLETSSYGAGVATQVSPQLDDDREDLKAVQLDTKDPLRLPLEVPSRYGFTQIYSPVGDALVDVVFVHGLNGDPHHTWTDEKSGTFWPAQLLPSFVEEEKARILTYGYEADMSLFTDETSMANLAESFVARLEFNRRKRKPNERPLIFVAHSLGGLLVKRALVYAAENLGKYTRSIFVSTYGILFLGTPHIGSDVAEWGSHLERICNAVLPRKLIDTQPQLVDALKRNSKTSLDIERRFLPLMSRFYIYTFHEGKPTNLKGTPQYVVNEESASPMIQGVERGSINSDHSHMCQFENDSAPGFDLVVEGIQRYAGSAPNTIAERWKMEKVYMVMKREQEGAIDFYDPPKDDALPRFYRPSPADNEFANADSLRRGETVETWRRDIDSGLSDIEMTDPKYTTRRRAPSVEEPDILSPTGPLVAIEDPADTGRFGDPTRREGYGSLTGKSTFDRVESSLDPPVPRETTFNKPDKITDAIALGNKAGLPRRRKYADRRKVLRLLTKSGQFFAEEASILSARYDPVRQSWMYTLKNWKNEEMAGETEERELYEG